MHKMHGRGRTHGTKAGVASKRGHEIEVAPYWDDVCAIIEQVHVT